MPAGVAARTAPGSAVPRRGRRGSGRSAASPAASPRPGRRNCRRRRPAPGPAPRRTGRTGSPPRAVRGSRLTAAATAKSGAGSAARSSFPLTVSGSASSTTTAAGTMYSGSRAATCSRSAAASSATRPAGRGDDVADQPLAAGLVLARDHRRLRHPRVARPARPRSRRARSGSRGSSPARRPARRTPARPPCVQRTRSPVRYIRSPAAPNGQATNRSAVSPARPR